MATQLPPAPTPPGFFAKVTGFFNNVLSWWGMAGLLWLAFTYASKNMTLIGHINWADATVIGALLAVTVMIGFTGSLALWRHFSPSIIHQEQKFRGLIGSRGTIQLYHQIENPTISFRQYAQRDASFWMVRRFLSKEFREDFEAASDTIRTNLDDLDPLAKRFLGELEKLANRWDVV